ncbi:MAG: acetyltransferase [Verrucomicrobiales bacterium]|nr:acetyltransferase [Verrucomicrobiales bacterium]
MSEIAIVGAGGHAKVVVESLLERTMEFSKIVVLDEKVITDDYWKKVEFNIELCPSANLLGCQAGHFHVAIGHNKTRETLASKTGENGAIEWSVFHPQAMISGASVIGSGSFVAAGSIIGPGTQLGRGCIVNHNAVVDHDCRVGNFCHVAPGSVLCGGVTVGERVLIGAGATVIPGIKLGNDCVIGAGAVVVKDVPAGTTFVGTPADKLDRIR